MARRPIGPGCRSRRYKEQNTLKHIDGTDEENTSEYSHAPSSQCSTLESNSGLPKTRYSKRRADSSSTDSESDYDEPQQTAIQVPVNRLQTSH